MNSYHVLWLQTTPSIASIYYHSYLTETHEFYCLDRGQQLKTLRSIARSLYNEITSSKKKVAVYCINPCSEKKYHGITNFLLKSQEDLKIKCLCLPTTLLQWSMLNAWSNNLDQYSEWKELCNIPFDTATFAPLPDAERVDEFTSFFAIADQQFSKKALIVHMSPELYCFSLEEGFQLKDFVSQTIQGWRKATDNWSLVWILDENELFGKKVEGLDDHRKMLRTSIQSYPSDIPIYTLTTNYDNKSNWGLPNQLAWIQHRHHLCLRESFLLKWAETPLFPSSYFDSLRCIYLNREAKMDDLKWRDNFLSMLNQKTTNHDPLHYIRSTTLGLPIDLSNYVTPLLSYKATDEEQETILRSGTHQVLFDPETVDNWIQSMQQYQPVLKWPLKIYEMASFELLDADNDTKNVMHLKEHVRGTYKTIERENESFSIHSKVEDYEIIIKGNQHEDGLFKMTSAYCTCKEKHCPHVMATLLLYVDMPIIFGTLLDTQSTVDLNSQKRNSETDGSSSSKRQRQSQEDADSAGFIPYGDTAQLVINLTNLPSTGEGSYDEGSQAYSGSQELQLTQQPESSLGDVFSSESLKDQLLSFPTLSSVGSIYYKESLSNPLAYSPARVNLKDVVSETTATDTLSQSSRLKGAANLTWQASSVKQNTQNATAADD